MNDQLVEFKTAKLAKEKGFDLICINGFHPDNKTPYEGNLWQELIRFPSERHLNRPTQSLLQKWLRETYYCHINVIPEPYINGINFNWQVLFYDSRSYDCWSDKSTGLYGDNGEFPTYELALEAALLKSLTLI